MERVVENEGTEKAGFYVYDWMFRERMPERAREVYALICSYALSGADRNYYASLGSTAKRLGMSAPAVDRALKYLKDKGLVRKVKTGERTIYQPSIPKVVWALRREGKTLPGFYIYDWMFKLKLSPRCRQVYAIIFSFNNNDQPYFRNLTILSERLGMKPPNVRRVLDTLAASGLITEERYEGAADTTISANVHYART